jgi:hypothetical protein
MHRKDTVIFFEKRYSNLFKKRKDTVDEHVYWCDRVDLVQLVRFLVVELIHHV